ncbi:MAG: caa(3)-type oxidase subunit IV [Deltaproteobacteria bacterium]|nr:caa(3)-type oxidase subunit IV [Deltaproteobacteria bacterium]
MADHAHEEHSEQHYIRIWAILLALLVVSILGPMLEIQAVTLVTAFGIALVKAYLVVKHFMHLNVQPQYVTYLLATALVFMLLLFAGTAPDVMKWEGQHWSKPANERPASDAGGSHH